MILQLEKIKISNSLNKCIRSYLKNGLKITSNRCFKDVVLACAEPRPNSQGTWITDDIVGAYEELNKKGFAHSVEVWSEEKLVGGLYLVSIGTMIFGESMFFKKTNVSKIALVALTRWARKHGGTIIDCQQETTHLASMGACPISNLEFMNHLKLMIENEPLPWVDKPITEESLNEYY